MSLPEWILAFQRRSRPTLSRVRELLFRLAQARRAQDVDRLADLVFVKCVLVGGTQDLEKLIERRELKTLPA